MFKQLPILEVKKDERNYILHLPENSNLGEVVDVLFDMRAIAMNTLQQLIEKEKSSENPIKQEEA